MKIQNLQLILAPCSFLNINQIYMSKRLKPSIGWPIDEVLTKIKGDLFFTGDRQEELLEEAIGTIENLRDTANRDVCVNPIQQNLILMRIRETVKSNNINGVSNDDANLTVLVNSFRLSCENCLNGECKQRDPEKLVPEKSKKQ